MLQGGPNSPSMESEKRRKHQKQTRRKQRQTFQSNHKPPKKKNCLEDLCYCTRRSPLTQKNVPNFTFCPHPFLLPCPPLPPHGPGLSLGHTHTKPPPQPWPAGWALPGEREVVHPRPKWLARGLPRPALPGQIRDQGLLRQCREGQPHLPEAPGSRGPCPAGAIPLATRQGHYSVRSFLGADPVRHRSCPQAAISSPLRGPSSM